MQKISNEIVDKLISVKATSKEIDFIIHISHFQNDDGCIEGVHYKEVCSETKMSYQGFYDVKQSLIDKGIISSEKGNRIDHDITIRNNSFKSEEDHKRGYVSTGHRIFRSAKFHELKAGAKLLAMKLMMMTRAGKNQYRIGTEKFYKDYTELFRVTKRVLRTYLMQLKAFFSIGIREGNYYIRPKKDIYKERGDKTDKELYVEHQVDASCRRNRIKVLSKKDRQDVCYLASHQYWTEAKAWGLDIVGLLKGAIETSILQLNEGKKRSRPPIRELKPKLIHKILKADLAHAEGTYTPVY